MICIHKKTGKCYRMLAHAVDCTNSRSPSPMIVYCPNDNEHSIFVREESEFYDKFDQAEKIRSEK